MDCEQVRELLDAYALGAAEPDEAAALEEHVADCVRCWSSLNEAQRAAAAIALSTAFQRAPDSLRNRVLAEAERRERAAGPRLLSLVRRLWPAGAAVAAAGAVAALTFAFVLQAQVNDLREDKDELVAEVQDAGDALTEQRQLMAVLAAPDVQQVRLEATDPGSRAVGVYHWSRATRTGALLCDNLLPAGEGQVYVVWLLTETGGYNAGSFYTWDGIGQTTMSLDEVPQPVVAIGVSIEDVAEAEEPGEMFLYAEFRR